MNFVAVSVMFMLTLLPMPSQQARIPPFQRIGDSSDGDADQSVHRGLVAEV